VHTFGGSSGKSKGSPRSIGTHYDTLGVEQTCSAQEIRDAFVKLSKQYHPDKIPDQPHLHNQFLHVREAYNVLSKSASRSSYDNILKNGTYRASLRVDTNSPHPFTESNKYELYILCAKYAIMSMCLSVCPLL